MRGLLARVMGGKALGSPCREGAFPPSSRVLPVTPPPHPDQRPGWGLQALPGK